MWIEQNHRRSRFYTVALLDAVEEGVLDKDTLIRDLLGYLSEDEVRDFVQKNDLIEPLRIREEEID